MKSLLDVRQAAEFLGVSRSTMYDYVAQGRLPYVRMRVGARKITIRFRQEALEEWVLENEVPARLDPMGTRR